MATISIHRALTIVAKANSSISTQIRSGLFIGTVIGASKRPSDRSFKTVEELQKRIQSDTDTVENNLRLVAKIKAAIMAKNLETFVKFDGREVSITELLAIKSTLDLRQEYVSRLRSQLNAANNAAERNQQDILSQVKSESGVDAAVFQKQLEDLNAISLVTGNGASVAEKIKELEEQNDFLKEEIDIILSETNLSTMIELED